MITDFVWGLLSIVWEMVLDLPTVPDATADSGIVSVIVAVNYYVPVSEVIGLLGVWLTIITVFFEIRLIIGFVGLIRGN